MLRKLVLLSIIFTLTSCLSDDTEDLGITQLGIITEVTAPEEVVYGETYTFDVKIQRPYECLEFSFFEIDKSTDKYILIKAILTEEYMDCDLDEQEELIDKSIEYTIDKHEEIEFRFVSERNDDGTYSTVKKVIPVIDEDE
ncbi:MAG: hypothetical protein L0J45_00670 [Psychroflexus sp.]|nr:hypothetical protein [Psychroflexus sp.]MDN6309194.1 hypothetical protein [Psychroflexus sp.]